MEKESISLITIFLSLGSSILVSLFTFILGLKAGKNQNDRQILKNHYRDLYVYFCNIKEGIETNVPLNWSKYKYEHINRKQGYVATPLKVKERNGVVVELQKNLIEKLFEEENQSLKYGWEFNQCMIKIKNEVIIFFEKQFDLSSYKRENQKEWNFFHVRRPPNGTPYHPVELSPELLLERKSFDDLMKKIESVSNLELSYISLQIPVKDKNRTVNIEISLLNDYKTLLENIYNSIQQKEYVIDLISAKYSRIKKVNHICKRISKRVREPHTFFNTLGNSFVDIFRN